jgi:hypothetical protein
LNNARWSQKHPNEEKIAFSTLSESGECGETIYRVNTKMLTKQPQEKGRLHNATVLSMSLSVIDILFHPDAFFRDIVNQKEDLKFPVLIVLAGSLAAAGYGYLIGGLTARMMSSAMPGIDTIITLSSVIGAVIGTFIFWIVGAGIFYAISYAFKGQGSFKRVLEVVGYGCIPQIFGSLITLIAAIGYVPKISVPTLTSAALQDPAVMEQTMKAFMHDPAMLELTQITSLVAVVFLLWSASIWIFGLQHARQLALRDAALCVGIPVILYVIYVIYNLGVM